MSLLYRAKSSTRVRHYLLQSVTSIQQSNLYSTKKFQNFPKTQQLTNRRTQESSESSSSFSDGIKSQSGEQIVRPKTIEIPYQAKVANRVDLIGYVRTVQFEEAFDGNSFAAIVISQEISGEREETLLIPVDFEGDLAQVVANHVRVNNCVLVSGRLSMYPIRFPLRDCPVNFHVVGENLNFVRGYRRGFSGKKPRVSFPGVEIDKYGHNEIENEKKIGDDDDFNQQRKEAIESAKMKRELTSVDSVDDDDDELNKQWKEALEYAKMKWKSTSVSSQLSAYSGAEKRDLVEVEPGTYNEENGDSAMKKKQKDGNDDDEDKQWKEALEYAKMKRWESSCVSSQMSADSEAEKIDLFEAKQEKCNDKGESALKKKKEDGDKVLDLWRDLVRNPLQWRDNRDIKSKGLVKKTIPDFKHMASGDELWMTPAPDWVLSGFENLEFYKGEDSWKNLVENPKKWWDYRDHKSKGLVKKTFPDFWHKLTHDGLWIDTAPDWVLSGLGKLEFDEVEDSWKNLVENPKNWWDNRLEKRFPKDYDFKHRETDERLWVSEAPAWALSKLPPLKKLEFDKEGKDSWKNLVENPKQWWDNREKKSKGLVKESFPDFKHKVTGDGLWIDNAPDWVLSGLEKLEFDVKVIEENGKIGTEKKIDEDRILDLWRDLVKNSLQWWDFRDYKLNGLVKETSPDFEHKVTRDGLWIKTAPHWVLSEFKKQESDKVWKNLVENHKEWWDYRDHKSKGVGNFPDFEHKVTRDRLWINNAPHWVLSELKKLEFDKGEDSWKNLVENPEKWWDNSLQKRFPKDYDFKHKETGERLWVSKAPAWALSKLPPLKDR